ncbi:hypothetical protein FIBSPDRAFT_1036666 [Athelia psychrophila]|uniref:Bacteriophage T5 Orf172 DNA-binding domain-containing protein n=1 Tax=Athelia psychrophila TaxID=1759441 RepID=A0A166VA56_9AGAM|nr:hypothetical protein FIBSPDRAFT_1036666 [Fibularhizoctonia sp. CBS 109695]
MASPRVAPSDRDDLVSRFDALALSGGRRDPNRPPLTSLPVPRRGGGFIGGPTPVSPSPVRRRPESSAFAGESPPAAGASFMRPPIFAMPVPDRQPKPLTMACAQTPPPRNGKLSPPVPSTPPARPETVPGVIPRPSPLTSKSDPNTTPTRPRRLRVESTPSPSTPSKGNTVKCSGVTNDGLDCTRQVNLSTLALSASHPDADTEIDRFCPKHIKKILNDNKGFYSLKGPDQYYIWFSGWVPDYLQPETQLALRIEMSKETSAADESGYIYTYEIRDPKTPQKIQLKVGRTVNLVKRIDQWAKQCNSKEQILLGWWPGVVKDAAGVRDLTVGTSLMKGIVKPGDKGPLVHRLERLVHLELGDLAVNAPYLQPDFPKTKIDTNDNGAGTPTKKAPASPAATKRLKGNPCSDCGQLHKEIFSLTRDEQGPYKDKEWELIVKPVIERWGKFVSEHA